MFLELAKLVFLFLFIILIIVPVVVSVSKNSLYDEWKKIWESEVEAKKRELAMQAVTQDKNKLIKKTKRI